LEEIPDEHRLHACARFTAPGRLAVEGEGAVIADRVVIATGSEPKIIPMVEEAGARLITNDDLFAMDALPSSVAVFGAGVVGLELAQALHRLGVRVRLFGVGGLVGPLTDPAVMAAGREVLAAAYPFDPESDVKEARERDGEVEIRFVEGGEVRSERFHWLLAATGRVPALSRLDLDKTGIELDDAGVPVVDRATCQCADSHVFVAGDAAGELPLLHEAADDGRVAGDNAGRHPEVRVRPRRTPLTVLFSRPEVALVGRTFEQLEQAGSRFQVGEVDFGEQGRAMVMDMAAGLLRIYGEENTGRLLGAEMVAPAGEHLAHLLAFAVQRDLTVLEALELPLYHPTLEEGFRTALRQLAHRLRMGPEPISRCLDCGPGG
jgi:dihydrolipoamide dehydrogenase